MPGTAKFCTPLLLAFAAYLLLPLPGSSAPLPERAQKKRAHIERAQRMEGVLSERLAADKLRVQSLRGQLRDTQRRLGRAQRRLDGERAELLRIRDESEVARDRLATLQARLRRARAGLAERLVELYKADEPDALTVVLEADGFADLLERTEFLERIASNDREVLERVRALKVAVEGQVERLDRLERRAEAITTSLLRRRDEIAAARDRLATTTGELVRARGRRAGTLRRVRASRVRAQEDLRSIEREQARVTQRLRGGSGGAPAPGPIRRGGGQLIWPLNGTVTSPFGQRWGRLHAGLDISVPEGTPIRAAVSGRVALAAPTGGYGNYACIQHGGALATCYAHQSRLGTSVGASVRQGQVIGYSGNTGNSTGPHLHFETRVNGSPIDPLGYL